MSIKRSLSYLLMALFLAGSFQIAYAKVDMANGLGHGNCEEMVKVASSNAHDHASDHSHDDTHTMHQQHDHEKECADGQCAHSYCVTPVFSAVLTELTFLDSGNPDGKILSNPQFTIDNYSPSLYRPPRV